MTLIAVKSEAILLGTRQLSNRYPNLTSVDVAGASDSTSVDHCARL